VLAPLFYHVFDERRCHNARVKCVIRPCFLILLLFSVHEKGVLLSPTISVGSAASTLTTTSLSSTKASMMLSLSSLIMKLAQQLLLGSPILSTKLPAYRINWLSTVNIRCKLKKYSNEDETGKKIEEDLSSLLSNFSTNEIRFALVATLAKLELDIEDLPVRRNKLIELFSQLIFDNMSI
jgi:hypothetical protein